MNSRNIVLAFGIIAKKDTKYSNLNCHVTPCHVTNQFTDAARDIFNN